MISVRTLIKPIRQDSLLLSLSSKRREFSQGMQLYWNITFHRDERKVIVRLRFSVMGTIHFR